MSNTQVVKADTLRSLLFSAMGASYVAVGADFDYPVRLVCLTNATDSAVLVSLDGSTDHFYLAANSFKLFDLNVNRKNVDQLFVLPVGTQFFVKLDGSPSAGSFYVECLYGVQS